MKLKGVAALLTLRQSIEGVVFGETDVRSWAVCLDGVGSNAALEAAVMHYRKSTKPLKPAHILKRA